MEDLKELTRLLLVSLERSPEEAGLCHSYAKVLSKRNLVCMLNNLCGSWKMFSFLVMLTWFVDLQIAKDAIDGSRIIEEDDVEMRPEMVSSSCTDENVCLDMCRKYCT